MCNVIVEGAVCYCMYVRICMYVCVYYATMLLTSPTVSCPGVKGILAIV